MRRDREREFVTGKKYATAFVVAKTDPAVAGLELRERRDPVLKLPFPVVPKFGRDLRPVARRMRHELFSIAIPRVFHLSKDGNAKTARISVNARTGKCAAHSN